jgi:hypothetical protein
MSPAQRTQIQARLAAVAAERAKAAASSIDWLARAKAVVLTPENKAANKAFAKAIVDRVLPNVTDKPATKASAGNGRGNGRGAKKQAAYRDRKGAALKAADAERKRAARAKKA